MGGQREGLTDLPPGKTRCSLYRRLDGLLGSVWKDAENLAPPEFDPQTVQPLASCYTDCVEMVSYKVVGKGRDNLEKLEIDGKIVFKYKR
jgi:hypothetical protein